MPFDRQAVAALRARMLAKPGPASALAAEAAALVEAARAAGDEAGEFEVLYLLSTLLAWQGAVAEAPAHLDRLAALDPLHPGPYALQAEFTRLAGDRRGAAGLCEDGWRMAEVAPPAAEGRGLLLGCWAWACGERDRFRWCVRIGNNLALAGELTDLDMVAFRGHVADAALDLEDFDLAYEQTHTAVKSFPRDATPPLVHFLWRRNIALCQVAQGELDADVTALLRDLVAEAERNRWTVWLPPLDAALALAPEA